MRAWVNGRLLGDAAQPAVTVSDHGLTVGDGVFEAVKVVGGQPFAIERHLDDGSAARWAGGNGDEALHFQRLERLADRSLAHLELRLQLALTRQPITGTEIFLGDQTLDFLSH